MQYARGRAVGIMKALFAQAKMQQQRRRKRVIVVHPHRVRINIFVAHRGDRSRQAVASTVLVTGVIVPVDGRLGVTAETMIGLHGPDDHSFSSNAKASIYW